MTILLAHGKTSHVYKYTYYVHVHFADVRCIIAHGRAFTPSIIIDHLYIVALYIRDIRIFNAATVRYLAVTLRLSLLILKQLIQV